MDLYVITGTTKGLGQALAAEVAKDATRFLVTLSRGAGSQDDRRIDIAADLADIAALERACDRMDAALKGKAFGKAVLVNNAGVVGPVGLVGEVDATALARNIAVNV